MATGILLGREAELDQLGGLISDAPKQGASLVISGAPGLGKTALLAAVADQAAELGWLVLRTAGIPSETSLPLAALHKLLRPVMNDVDRLAPSLRDAILGAFGLRDTDAPQIYRVAFAVLDLVAELATHRPVVVLVDDTQWIDRSSAEALAFIARRVDADPILVLLATRPVADDPFAESGLSELVLEPLSDIASGALLDFADAKMSARTRQSMLAAAAGNPLALLELPKSVTDADVDTLLPTPLPMTDRLERAFAARASTLPAVTRDLLLLVALNDSGSIAEALAACSAWRSVDTEIDDLDPAVLSGLIELDRTAVHFRHPLMRSAIYQSAGRAARQAAHGALARVMASDPDRAVWHRAASIVGASENVAAELDLAASRSQQRGSIPAAVAALERAASLSSSEVLLGGRLVLAAELSYEIGRTNLSERFLRDAGAIELGRHDQLRWEAVRERSDAVMLGGIPRIDALIEFAEQARAEDDPDLALRFLLRAATRCWSLDFGPEVELRVDHRHRRAGPPGDRSSPTRDPRVRRPVALRQRGHRHPYAAPASTGRGSQQPVAAGARGRVRGPRSRRPRSSVPPRPRDCANRAVWRYSPKP